MAAGVMVCITSFALFPNTPQYTATHVSDQSLSGVASGSSCSLRRTHIAAWLQKWMPFTPPSCLTLPHHLQATRGGSSNQTPSMAPSNSAEDLRDPRRHLVLLERQTNLRRKDREGPSSRGKGGRKMLRLEMAQARSN